MEARAKMALPAQSTATDCRPLSGGRAAHSFVFDVELEDLAGAVSLGRQYTDVAFGWLQKITCCFATLTGLRNTVAQAGLSHQLNRSQTRTAQKYQFGTHLRQPRRRGTAALIGGYLHVE